MDTVIWWVGVTTVAICTLYGLLELTLHLIEYYLDKRHFVNEFVAFVGQRSRGKKGKANVHP